MNAKPSRYRWAIASRVLAAGLGGYGLTSLLSAVLALLLPWLTNASRADGVLAASLLSFTVYTVVVIWIFSTRSIWRVWAVLAGGSLLSYGLLLALQAAWA